MISLLLLIVGVCQLGQPLSAALTLALPNDGTLASQGCWFTLCPGQTDDETSSAILTEVADYHAAEVTRNPVMVEYGYFIPYRLCASFLDRTLRTCLRTGVDEADTEVRVDLTDADVRLGEVIAQLGRPASMWMCAGYSPFLAVTGDEGVQVHVEYANGITISAFTPSKRQPPIYPTPANEWRVRHDMKVFYIEYLPATPSTGRVDNELFSAWRGFTTGPAHRSVCGN